MEAQPNLLHTGASADQGAAVPPLARPGRASRPRRWFIIGLLILFCVLCAPLVYGGIVIGIAAADIRTQILAAKEDFSGLAFAEARQHLREAGAAVPLLRGGVKTTGAWTLVPWIGPRLRWIDRAGEALELTFEAADDLSAAAERARAWLVRLTGSAHASTSEERREAIRELTTLASSVRLGGEKARMAMDRWRELDLALLPQAWEVRARAEMEEVTIVEDTLEKTLQYWEPLMFLGGYPEKKRFLVLLQNADELRPTGGFIGVVGRLEIDNGMIKTFQFDDVYAQDAPLDHRWTDIPPAPMIRWLGVKAWYVRDRNWSPDFPQSAVDFLEAYGRAEVIRTGRSALSYDGVIALEPAFFAALLRMTGPITLEDKTFTAENYFDLLEYEVERGFHEQQIGVDARKRIVATLGDVLRARLEALPLGRWPEIFALFFSSLDQKDILVYVRDAKALAAFDRRGWTGRVRSSTGDYLWVVDANLAALKTDGVMKKEILYRLDTQAPGGPLATVKLLYENPKGFSWKHTRYRDYVRVYVPEGSELISARGSMKDDRTKTGGQVVAGDVDVGRDLGKTFFGAFWAIEPGEKREMTFTYRLPASAIGNEMYTLLVQKQPGSNTQLTLDLSFGKNIKRATPPEPETEKYGDPSYRGTFSMEKDFVMEGGF